MLMLGIDPGLANTGLAAVAQHDIRIIELTPQQVECASGLSSKARKA